MKIPIYHVDAFTDHLFSGNPAAVCVLDYWLPDPILQQLATENNLPVTAFLVREKNYFAIRWLTPEYELDLCGHGTLAAAHVIFKYLAKTSTTLELHSPAGPLQVSYQEPYFCLDFPSKTIEIAPDPLHLFAAAFGVTPEQLYRHQNERCMAVFPKEEIIKNLQIHLPALKELAYRGIIVTAPGITADFVSRVFYPQKTILEDAVTGAAHCLLAPYWGKRLNKTKLYAQQLSPRGGSLHCELTNERVFIRGTVVDYLQGLINAPDCE